MATWCRLVKLESPDGHDIPLDGVFVFEDLDPSSDEVIDYLVIGDLPPGRGGGHQRWQGQLDGARTPSAATPCARRMASPAPMPSGERQGGRPW